MWITGVAMAQEDAEVCLNGELEVIEMQRAPGGKEL